MLLPNSLVVVAPRESGTTTKMKTGRYDKPSDYLRRLEAWQGALKVHSRRWASPYTTPVSKRKFIDAQTDLLAFASFPVEHRCQDDHHIIVILDQLAASSSAPTSSVPAPRPAMTCGRVLASDSALCSGERRPTRHVARRGRRRPGG